MRQRANAKDADPQPGSAHIPSRQVRPIPLSRRKWRAPARSVGSFVPGLTQKAFEKYGFCAATLVTDWKMIAGLDLAQISRPEKLAWPRLGRTAANTTEISDSSQNVRPGATLILRVEPAHALDMQYSVRQLLDRINTFYGYRAVERVKILQAPLPRTQKSSSSPTIPITDKKLEIRPSFKVRDKALGEALARLHASILAHPAGT